MLQGDKLYNVVPCGQCAECQDERINSYMARSDAEMKDTNENHGLAYVDTLTYNDDWLPILTPEMKVVRNCGDKYDENHVYSKGIPVFYRKDVRAMFLRLRTSLERAGYYDTIYTEKLDSNGEIIREEKHIVRIKHLVSEEYGGEWHRPHYHCEFFIQHNISAEEFQKFLQNAWIYGNLDYWKKVPMADGTTRQVPKLPADKVISGPAALHYVAKYIVKDDDYIATLVDALSDGDEKNYSLSLQHKCKYLKSILPEQVYKNILPRPFVSNGFGISLANKFVFDPNRGYVYSDLYQFMYDNGILEVKNNQGEVTNVCKIPQYIQRKLWYELIKDFDGSVSWILTEEGVQHKLDRIGKSVDFLTQRYINIFDNIGNYYSDPSDQKNLVRKNEILSLLDGRSLEDFVVYKLFYKGSLYLNSQDLERDIYLKSSTNSRRLLDLSYDFSNDLDLFGDFHDLLNKVYSISKDHRFLQRNLSEHDHRMYIVDLLGKFYSINEMSSDEFTDFDKLDFLFDKYQNFRNQDIIKLRREKYEDQKKAKLMDPTYMQHEINNQAHRASIVEQIKDIRYGYNRTTFERFSETLP